MDKKESKEGAPTSPTRSESFSTDDIKTRKNVKKKSSKQTQSLRTSPLEASETDQSGRPADYSFPQHPRSKRKEHLSDHTSSKSEKRSSSSSSSSSSSRRTSSSHSHQLASSSDETLSSSSLSSSGPVPSTKGEGGQDKGFNFSLSSVGGSASPSSSSSSSSSGLAIPSSPGSVSPSSHGVPDTTPRSGSMSSKHKKADKAEKAEKIEKIESREIERSSQDIQIQKAVFEGAKQGNMAIVTALFSSFSSAVEQQKLANVKNDNGQGPLHLAAMNGHAELVDFLLERKANANLRDSEQGRTPLHYACTSGSMGCVSSLLSKPRHINATDPDNVCPPLFFFFLSLFLTSLTIFTPPFFFLCLSALSIDRRGDFVRAGWFESVPSVCREDAQRSRDS